MKRRSSTSIILLQPYTVQNLLPSISFQKKVNLEWSPGSEILFRSHQQWYLWNENHWSSGSFWRLQLIRIDILVEPVQLRCIHCYVIWTTKRKSFLWRCRTLVSDQASFRAKKHTSQDQPEPQPRPKQYQSLAQRRCVFHAKQVLC